MWSALATILAGLALALSGCGGGSPKVDTTPAQLVSQSLEGTIVIQVSVNGTTNTTTAQHELYLNADTLSVRLHTTTSMKTKGKVVEVTADMILDPSQKRITEFHDATVDGKQMMKNCTFLAFPKGVPDVTMIKQLITDKLKTTKPSSMEDGYRKFEIQMPVPPALFPVHLPPGTAVNVDASANLDSTDVVHKFSVTEEITTEGTTGRTSQTFTPTNVQGGAPDPSHFQVPSDGSWGKCEPATPAHEVPEIARMHSHLLRLLLTEVTRSAPPAEEPKTALVV